MDNKEKERILAEFANKISNQQPCPPEFLRLFDENFWELVGEEKEYENNCSCIYDYNTYYNYE